MTEKHQKIIDIVQWVLIGIMVVICTIVFIGNIQLTKNEEVIKSEYSFMKIYNSQRISELEKQNKELKDSLDRIINRMDVNNE